MRYKYKADPYSSHAKIIEIIRKEGANLTVLDVGCASGYIGKELGPGYKLVGIDADKESAKVAKKYYEKIIIADIDTYVPEKRMKYDVIIFGDVLEHLKEPEKVLGRFKTALKNTGIIIISLPNIALWVLRLRLLFGKFDYEEIGPMDRTHLHFYTLKTAKELVASVNMRTKKVFAIPIPFPLISSAFRQGNPPHALHILNNYCTQLWKRGCAYQFVLVASK